MHIEPKTREAVEKVLRGARGPVSEADVAAAAGLDLGTTRAALYTLMRRYRCALQVHDDGTLVYDFGPRLVALDEASWGDRLRRVGHWLWRGFQLAYKTSLAVVLTVYAVVFVALILAVAIAASMAAEDEAPASGALHLVGAVFRAIFEFATVDVVTFETTDRYGYRHRHYEPKAPVFPRSEKKKAKQPHAKSFVASVYDFVFGPARVSVDDREKHREVAAFVRRHHGVLTVADVQALSGMSRDEAGRFFTLFVAENEGEVEITEAGTLLARFPELLRSARKGQDAAIVYYWDEYEPPYELTGNTAGKNVAIVALAAFNLACGLGVTQLTSDVVGPWLWLGAVPAFVFSLFFAIPLLRAPYVWAKNRQQHARNIQKRLYRSLFGAAFEERRAQISVDELVAKTNRAATTEERLEPDALQELIEETLRQVGGSLDVDTRARRVLNLEHLCAEAEVRDAQQVEAAPARVVFSTSA